MTDYKSMFEQAVRTLAAIDEALGIGDDGCGDPDQTLTAIEELKAAKGNRLVNGVVDTPQEQEHVATVQCVRGVTIGYLEKMLPVGTKLYTAQPAEPVAWAATSEDGEVEALGMNQSRRFDTPLCFCATPHTEAAHCIACGEVGGHKDTCARVRWGIAHT